MYGPDEDDVIRSAPGRSPEDAVWFVLMSVGLFVSGVVWGAPFAG